VGPLPARGGPATARSRRPPPPPPRALRRAQNSDRAWNRRTKQRSGVESGVELTRKGVARRGRARGAVCAARGALAARVEGRTLPLEVVSVSPAGPAVVFGPASVLELVQ